MKKDLESKPQEKITVLVILGLAVISGIIFFFLLPNISIVDQSHLLFVKRREEVKSLLQAGSTSQVLARQIKVCREKILELNNGFISQDQEIDFIRFMEDLSKRHFLTQSINLSESVAPPAGQQGFPEASLALSLTGKFTDLLSYLDDLEKSRYYINIQEVNIKTQTNQDSNLLFTRQSGHGQLAKPEAPDELLSESPDSAGDLRETIVSVQVRAKVFSAL